MTQYQNNYDYRKTIRIYACNIGANVGNDSYLQKVANELYKRRPCNREVTIQIEAPIHDLYSTPNKNYTEIKHYRKTQEIKINIVGHEYDDEGRILSPILEYETITEGEVIYNIFKPNLD